MIVKVHMLAFHDKDKIREVEISDGFELSSKVMEALEEVFKMGQNEFQQRPCPSVSMGDVIEFEVGGHKYWQVKASGFRALSQEEFDNIEGHFTQSDKFIELFTRQES